MAEEATDCRKAVNAGIYAPPRNWEVACAATQAAHKVPLTDAQKSTLASFSKWNHHNPTPTMAEMHRTNK